MDKKIKNLIKKISEMPRVSAIFLFGSRANSKARKDSDFDIAVLTSGASAEDELAIIGMGDDRADVSVFSRLPLIIQFRILKEGKVLFCKDYQKIYDTKVEVFKKYLDYSIFINRFYRRVVENV